jgi:hypothetical protein
MSHKIPTGEKLIPYTVFVDSNCLYTPNEVEIVNPSFSDLLKEIRSKCEIELAIPDIVAREILNKKLDDCEACLKEIASKVNRIAKLTVTEPVRLPNIEDLQLNLKARFDRWVESLGATIIPVPTAIDWTSLIEKAVSRRPPFSPRSEKGEKGFKDALILETLLELHKCSPDRAVVFVCADVLLSKTACDHLAGPTFLAVSSLDEFRSHLELRITQTSEKFTRALLTKAKEVFYTESNPNCIWLKFKVREEIHKSFGAQWSGDKYETLEQNLLTPTALIAVTKEFVYIDETAFVTLDDEHFYHWQTKVELRQIFRPREFQPFNEQIRKLVTSVKWKAKISDSPTSDFTEESIEGGIDIEVRFGTPDRDDRVQLRHFAFVAGLSLEQYADSPPPLNDVIIP